MPRNTRRKPAQNPQQRKNPIDTRIRTSSPTGLDQTDNAHCALCHMEIMRARLVAGAGASLGTDQYCKPSYQAPCNQQHHVEIYMASILNTPHQPSATVNLDCISIVCLPEPSATCANTSIHYTSNSSHILRGDFSLLIPMWSSIRFLIVDMASVKASYWPIDHGP